VDNSTLAAPVLVQPQGCHVDSPIVRQGRTRFIVSLAIVGSLALAACCSNTLGSPSSTMRPLGHSARGSPRAATATTYRVQRRPVRFTIGLPELCRQSIAKTTRPNRTMATKTATATRPPLTEMPVDRGPGRSDGLGDLIDGASSCEAGFGSRRAGNRERADGQYSVDDGSRTWRGV
jgi:hypothetical protein